VTAFVDLFWTFVKIGLFTFGGGYAMVPVIERELINRKAWINMDEVLDYYTIAQVTPGIIAVNISTFVGYRRKGVAGGILATVGFVLPGILLMTLVSLFLKRFAEYPPVRHVFAGIRIAVGALILDTILKLLRNLVAPAAAADVTAASGDAAASDTTAVSGASADAPGLGATADDAVSAVSAVTTDTLTGNGVTSGDNVMSAAATAATEARRVQIVFSVTAFAAAFVLSAFFKLSAALIVLAAAWAGFLCFRPGGFRFSNHWRGRS
jgi:chromate transporter